jgi:hypothetical protein
VARDKKKKKGKEKYPKKGLGKFFFLLCKGLGKIDCV